MSTTQSRDQELQSKNPTACPVVRTLNRVGTQWRLNILYSLQGSELRFNELKRSTGARSKTLSEALDALTEEDLVIRRTEAADPIAVYYTLSEKGETLVDQLDGISEWAVEWVDDVADPEAQRPQIM